MSILTNITQTHFSVLFADKATSNPIQRMPVYAEIAITELVGGYVIDEKEFSVHHEPNVQESIRKSIARQMDKDDFDKLTADQKNKLSETIVALVSETDFVGKTAEEKQKLFDELVAKALELLDISYIPPQLTKTLRSHPLSYVATDHIGYASFDLRSFKKNHLKPEGVDPAKTEYAFYVYPMGKEESRLEALVQARITKEAVFAKFAIDTPIFANDIRSLNLPSMQNPSLVDWYFSPGSFAAKPNFLVGEDGCEQLMPAQLALSQFNFRQVVRVAGTPTEADGWPKAKDIGPLPADAKYAFVDEYQASWYALGHSLGEIQYSLPLAPGESVKLAVIDWSWDSLTSRDEKTRFTEEVLHQTHRDRTISESVKATVDEWQRGGNIQAGIAGGSGAAGSSGGKGFSSGNAWSLGGAYSTSSGSRKLAADNVQKLSDSFVQASSAQRELNSTVVIQARQEEKESIQTRTFTNYNHSHTLTILYYEVLRHFKLEVEWKRRMPAVLVPGTTIRFSDSTQDDILNILKYRHRIEDNLLDPKIRTGFDALEELISEQKHHEANPAPSPLPEERWEGESEFVLFEFHLKTGSGDSATPEMVMIHVIHSDGVSVHRPLLKVWEKWDLREDINFSDRLNHGDEWSSFIAIIPNSVKSGNPPAVVPHLNVPRVRWSQLVGFEFVIYSNNGWDLRGLEINGFCQDRLVPLFKRSEAFAANTWQNGDSFTVINIERPGPKPPVTASPITKTPRQMLDKSKLAAIDALTSHLKENRAYYQRIVFLSKARPDIECELDKLTPPLTGLVSPIPAEVFGDYICYSLLAKIVDSQGIDQPDLEKKAERLITLPTRGVFAEGKLGHCNISEEIDNTRFWKWDEHPIPVQAPDIAPIQAVTPQPQPTNIAAGAFPAALLSIVNPSPAPDPTGLGDALKVMAASNIFRDMSGRIETADVMKKLSDNSVRFAEIAEKALHPDTTSQKQGSGQQGSSQQGGSGQQFTGQSSLGATSMRGANTTNATEQGRIDRAQQTADLAKSMLGYGANEPAKKALGRVAESLARPELQTVGFTPQEIQIVTQFVDLIKFQLPLELVEKLKNRSMSVQKFHDALGDLNLDFYPILISKLPVIGGTQWDADQLLKHIRTNINDFIKTRYALFEPYDDSIDKAVWQSNAPYSSVIHIDMGGLDNGDVVTSQASNQQWRFTTIRTPKSGTHPVSGTREFGYRKTTAGSLFYVRGADRSTGVAETVGDVVTFMAGHWLWESYVEKVIEFVNSNGGVAEMRQNLSRRFHWMDVVIILGLNSNDAMTI